MKARDLIQTARALITQTHYEMRPFTTIESPDWQFYAHPGTLEAIKLTAQTDHHCLRYDVGGSVKTAITIPTTGQVQLFGMPVQGDLSVMPGKLELRYAIRHALDLATDELEPQYYYCPAAGEIEQYPGGGFDTCCDAIDRHEPISPQALAAVRREAVTKYDRRLAAGTPVAVTLAFCTRNRACRMADQHQGECQP